MAGKSDDYRVWSDDYLTIDYAVLVIRMYGSSLDGLDMAQSSFHKLATIWGRDVAYVLNIQHSQRVAAEQQTKALQRREAVKQSQKVKQAEAVKSEISRRSKIIRRAYEFAPRQNIQRSRGIGL
jgi:hypothetical protein